MSYKASVCIKVLFLWSYDKSLREKIKKTVIVFVRNRAED